MPNILIVTVGGTPPIVTEVLYGLMRPSDGTPPWVPDRIILTTTSAMRDVLLNGGSLPGGRASFAALCGPEGKLAQLYMSLGFVGPTIGERDIIVARTAAGLIPDLRTQQQVLAFADTMLAVVRDLAADETTNLHVSIAGGRKTMGAIMMQIMGLYGRPQDALTHLLIEPPERENAPDFWWPERPGESLDIHPVPYVRISAHLESGDALRPGQSYEGAVTRANEALNGKLMLEVENRSVRVGDDRVILTKPTEFVALLVLATARQRGITPRWVGTGTRRSVVLGSDPQAWPKLLGFCRVAVDFRGAIERGEPSDPETEQFRAHALREGRPFDAASFASEISGAKAKLRHTFLARIASKILVSRKGHGTQCAFEPDRIEIVWPAGYDPEAFMQSA